MEQQAKLAESLLEENEAMAKQYNQQVGLPVLWLLVSVRAACAVSACQCVG